MNPTPVKWRVFEGLTPYETATQHMQERVVAIQQGHAAECVWLLEHSPLYTAGTSAKKEDLLDPRFPIFNTGRGGQYTYHGPGQRICYVMLDLSKHGKDIRRYIYMLEEWGIQALRSFGVNGVRNSAGIGIWVETAQGLAKIAAIGVRISKWVTSHGIAFNISTDLSHYNGIIPCGLRHAGVTRLIDLIPSVDIKQFDNTLRYSFNNIFYPSNVWSRSFNF